MSTINPELLNTQLSAPAPDIAIPTDPLALSEAFKELQILANSRQLTAEEIQRGVAITRALRRTNTGPAKAKTSKAKAAKPSVSLDDLLSD